MLYNIYKGIIYVRHFIICETMITLRTDKKIIIIECVIYIFPNIKIFKVMGKKLTIQKIQDLLFL